MIYKDIITEIKSDSTLFAIVGNRVKSSAPIDAPKLPYITFSRQDRDINMVRTSQFFRFMLYAPSIEEREALLDAFNDFIIGRHFFSDTSFFKVWHESDGTIDTKLKTGHYAGYVIVGMRKAD